MGSHQGAERETSNSFGVGDNRAGESPRDGC